MIRLCISILLAFCLLIQLPGSVAMMSEEKAERALWFQKWNNSIGNGEAWRVFVEGRSTVATAYGGFRRQFIFEDPKTGGDLDSSLQVAVLPITETTRLFYQDWDAAAKTLTENLYELVGEQTVLFVAHEQIYNAGGGVYVFYFELYKYGRLVPVAVAWRFCQSYYVTAIGIDMGDMPELFDVTVQAAKDFQDCSTAPLSGRGAADADQIIRDVVPEQIPAWEYTTLTPLWSVWETLYGERKPFEDIVLAQREFVDAFTMAVPESFELLDDATARLRFPNEPRPGIILANGDVTVNLCFEIVTPAEGEGLKEMMSRYIYSVKTDERYPADRFYSETNETLPSGLQLCSYDYHAAAPAGVLYTIHFFVALPDGNILLGWLLCPLDQRSRWEPITREMMKTVTPAAPPTAADWGSQTPKPVDEVMPPVDIFLERYGKGAGVLGIPPLGPENPDSDADDILSYETFDVTGDDNGKIMYYLDENQKPYRAWAITNGRDGNFDDTQQSLLTFSAFASGVTGLPAEQCLAAMDELIAKAEWEIWDNGHKAKVNAAILEGVWFEYEYSPYNSGNNYTANLFVNFDHRRVGWNNPERWE